MKSTTQNDLVLTISCAQDNRWYVTAQDAAHPLASFADAQQACTWAIARARPARGKVLVEQLATTASVDSNARAFNFSIPVTWGGESERFSGRENLTRAIPRSRSGFAVASAASKSS